MYTIEFYEGINKSEIMKFMGKWMGTGKDHIRLPRLRKTNIMYSLLRRC